MPNSRNVAYRPSGVPRPPRDGTSKPKGNEETGMNRLLRIIGHCGISMGLLAAATASADDFPNKPVRIIVPYPAGGTTDMVARMIGDQLTVMWKQPVLV